MIGCMHICLRDRELLINYDPTFLSFITFEPLLVNSCVCTIKHEYSMFTTTWTYFSNHNIRT